MTSESEKHKLSRLLENAIDETSSAYRERWHIPGYTLCERLGAGTSGLVYRAQRDHCQSAVALKVLRPEFGSGQSDGRMLVEMKALASLHHKGIARFIDGGTFDDEGDCRRFLVLELINGNGLARYAEDNDLSTEAALELIAKVADALHYAHSQGVVHRDLKPSNILVDHEGKPHVVDFGLARLTHAEDGNGPTLTGEVMGTPSFMSPEQTQAFSSAGPAGDIYSLGAVAYLLLSGQPPHDVAGLPPHQAIARISELTVVPVGEQAAQLSNDQSTVIMTALARDPKHRYPSAKAFADDLRAAAAGHAIKARKPTPLQSLARHAQRHWLALGTMILLLIVTTFAILAWRMALQESRRSANAEHLLRTLFEESILEQLSSGVSLEQREQFRRRIDGLTDDYLKSGEPGNDLLWIKARRFQIYADVARLSARWDDAAELFERAVNIFTELKNREPNNPTRHAELSTAMVRLGDVSKERSDLSAAIDQYERILALDEALVARWPKEWRLLDNLTWSYERTAVVHGLMDNDEESTHLHRLRHATSVELVAAKPDRALSYYTLSTSCVFMTRLVSHPAEKLKLATDAVTAADQAFKLASDNPDLHDYCVFARTSLLNTYLLTGRTAQTISLAADLKLQAARLTATPPCSIQSWVTRAQAHHCVAKALNFSWEECLATESAFNAALKDHPRHQATRRELAQSLRIFEHELRQGGRLDQAQLMADKLVAHQRATVALFPNDAQEYMVLAELWFIANCQRPLSREETIRALESAITASHAKDRDLLLRAAKLWDHLQLASKALSMRSLAEDL